MKKIAFVFPNLLPMPAVHGGASETLVQHLIDDNECSQKCMFYIYCKFDDKAQEASRKYQFTKFFYIREDDSFIGKIKFLIYRVRRKLCRSYIPEPYLVQLTRQLAKEDYDKIVVESVFWFSPYLKRKTGGNLLLHLHFDAVAMNHIEMRRSLEACDGVLCVSRFIETSIRRFSPQTSTCVLQNVTDVDLFDKCVCAEDAKTLRNRLGIGADDVVVVYAGRLMQVKGVMELVKAFQIARHKIPNIKLVLVGSAEYGRNVEDLFYEQLLEQIGNDLNRFIYMTGYIAHEKMPSFYAMADIAVLPTIGVEEASGLSALEPLAAGCRFIGSDSGGIPEVACSEDTIIISRDEDFITKLANAIIQCAEAPAVTLPSPGQLHVRKEHNAQNYYERFLSCLQEIP